MVNNWNDLPNWVINADTVKKFEVHLDKYWKHQNQKFNYTEQISTTILSDYHSASITGDDDLGDPESQA